MQYIEGLTDRQAATFTSDLPLGALRLADLSYWRLVNADLFPQLRLQAQDGTVYLFNVLTRTYEQTIAPPVLTPLPPTPEPYVIDPTELPFSDDPPPTLPPVPTLPPTTEAAPNAVTGCALYALALHAATVEAARTDQTIRDLPSGQARRAIVWLSWMARKRRRLCWRR